MPTTPASKHDIIVRKVYVLWDVIPRWKVQQKEPNEVGREGRKSLSLSKVSNTLIPGASKAHVCCCQYLETLALTPCLYLVPDSKLWCWYELFIDFHPLPPGLPPSLLLHSGRQALAIVLLISFDPIPQQICLSCPFKLTFLLWEHEFYVANYFFSLIVEFSDSHCESCSKTCSGVSTPLRLLPRLVSVLWHFRYIVLMLTVTYSTRHKLEVKCACYRTVCQKNAFSLLLYLALFCIT